MHSRHTNPWAANLRVLLADQQRQGAAASASRSCRQTRWIPVKMPKKNAPK